jgi:hypothetical protein
MMPIAGRTKAIKIPDSGWNQEMCLMGQSQPGDVTEEEWPDNDIVFDYEGPSEASHGEKDLEGWPPRIAGWAQKKTRSKRIKHW